MRSSMSMSRRQCLRAALCLPTGLLLTGCGSGGSGAPPATSTRTWRMGFSGLPPRFTVQESIRTIDLWSPRAELAIIHEELPWTALLSGESPHSILQRDKVGLVAYYRGKGHRLIYLLDLNNGLAREREAPQLAALGRSITEPAVQQAFRSFAVAVAQVLRPDYLGLAAETNLIRLAAPALYPAVKQTANATAADVRTAGYGGPLFVSVQVEAAWGRLGGNTGFVGIAQDRADFAFAQMMGLSSYPYLAYATPQDIAADHYSRLFDGASALPAMVVEGGWPSVGADSNGVRFDSTAALQAQYVQRHATLLDSIGALAWVHLQFADIDLAAYPPPIPANLPLFASLGFVDSQYGEKPALAQWDALFARPRV
jgi:hypothetical protein